MNRELDMRHHLQMLENRATRRFLSEPELVTNFGDELLPTVKSRLDVGRKFFLQIPDFEEQA